MNTCSFGNRPISAENGCDSVPAVADPIERVDHVALDLASGGLKDDVGGVGSAGDRLRRIPGPSPKRRIASSGRNPAQSLGSLG